MKKIVILGIGASMFFLGSCVESSQKYKSLQARLDSLSTVHIMQNSEMESMLADLNDISAGMQSLRDAERLLTMETINENKANSKSKQQLNQLKKDVQAITEAIASYKEQISKLEGKNKSQSAEFKRLIVEALKSELHDLFTTGRKFFYFCENLHGDVCFYNDIEDIDLFQRMVV